MPRILRSIVKRTLALLPAPLDVYVSDFARYAGSRTHRQKVRLSRNALAELGNPGHVLTGPFQGMKYPLRSAGQGGLISKLVGSYEKELAAVIEQLIGSRPSFVIDIGAAEGYYVTGFAMRLPDARVIAYEMEKPLRSLVRKLAAANGVAQRVVVRGACSVPELRKVLADEIPRGARVRTVILCDVEGFEDELLDIEQIPELRAATILCEAHDLVVRGVTERLSTRFDESHHIRHIRSQSRTTRDVPARLPLSKAEVVLDEGRLEPMTWLFMQPKSAEFAVDSQPA